MTTTEFHGLIKIKNDSIFWEKHHSNFDQSPFIQSKILKKYRKYDHFLGILKSLSKLKKCNVIIFSYQVLIFVF